MPKVIRYGTKTKQEKQNAYFRQQIEQMKVYMGVGSRDDVGKAAGFGPGKMYRLYRDPGKLKTEDAKRLEALFERYGMRLGLTMEGGSANAC